MRKSISQNRGIVLIAVYFLIATFLILGGVFFRRVFTEKEAARTQIDIDSCRYLAGAGLNHGIVWLKANLPEYSGSDKFELVYNSGKISLGKGSYIVRAYADKDNQYQYLAVSTGYIDTGPKTHAMRKTLIAEVQAEPEEEFPFQYAIETSGELIIHGNPEINGEVNKGATLDFLSLFGCEKEKMKSDGDTHLYTDTLYEPIDGITWVDVTPETELMVTGNLAGSGILIINGDVHFGGTIDFDGIIYVIGALELAGTPTINGTILAESGTDIDTTVSGSAVTITYNKDKIFEALEDLLGFKFIKVVSWRES